MLIVDQELKPSTLPSWGRSSIISALQQLLSMPFPSSSEPSQTPHFVDQPMPHQEPPTGEATVTQEVLLPPYFSIAFVTLRTMFSLVGGESWGSKLLLLMLSYFGNLVVFCLILKFLKVFILLSMLIKEKFSNWNKINWIFVFSLDLEFVLCLLKLMNCWNFYWIRAYVFHFKLFTHCAQ